MEEIVDLCAGMFGLLTRPSGTAVPTSICVILVNAGNMHRCGPFRLHVRLARRLAELGYATLRFDVPGVGDSLRRADKPQHEVMLEMLEQIEARTGYRRFVVGGICAGADTSWHMALADPRIVGLFQLDGLARRGLWFLAGRMARGLRKSPAAWLAWLRSLARARSGEPQPILVTPEDLREWPARGSERGQLAAMLGRGVELFALFTGGTSYLLHPRQFEGTFGPAAQGAAVRFRHWPECDHLFYAESDRERLIEELADWLRQRLPR
jgi:pimeloyl-ACP methyl ester carboxylesterase